jgi:hypothetical protein
LGTSAGVSEAATASSSALGFHEGAALRLRPLLPLRSAMRSAMVPGLPNAKAAAAALRALRSTLLPLGSVLLPPLRSAPTVPDRATWLRALRSTLRSAAMVPDLPNAAVAAATVAPM